LLRAQWSTGGSLPSFQLPLPPRPAPPPFPGAKLPPTPPALVTLPLPPQPAVVPPLPSMPPIAPPSGRSPVDGASPPVLDGSTEPGNSPERSTEHALAPTNNRTSPIPISINGSLVRWTHDPGGRLFAIGGTKFNTAVTGGTVGSARKSRRSFLDAPAHPGWSTWETGSYRQTFDPGTRKPRRAVNVRRGGESG
jgi:hypothetical protein